jgi:hypothetical protein
MDAAAEVPTRNNAPAEGMPRQAELSGTTGSPPRDTDAPAETFLEST